MAMTPDPGKSGTPDTEHDPQLAALYRAGAAGRPPAHLDDAICAAARREVQAGPRRHGLRRWSVPVSLAAVVILSVTVVTLMREQGADLPESMILPPPAAKPEAAKLPAPVLRKQEMPAPAAPAIPEAAVPAQKLSGPAELSVSTEDRERRAEQGISGFDNSTNAKGAIAETSRANEAPGRRDQAPSRRMRRSASTIDAAPAGGADRSAEPAAALSAAPVRRTLWQDLVEEPPEKWIQRIAEFRRAGRVADADALMAEFRRRFPDQPLPGDAR